MLQIPVGEVEQVAVQVDDLHVGAHLHLLVHQRLVVAGERPGVEAQHPIRVPAAVADEATEHPGEAGDGVDGVAGRTGHDGGDGRLQFGREPLVCIQPQHPFGLDMGLGEAALATEARPGGVDEEAGAEFGGDGGGVILTAGVQDDDFVHQAIEGGEAGAQVVGFVLDDQDGRQGRFFHRVWTLVDTRRAGHARIGAHSSLKPQPGHGPTAPEGLLRIRQVSSVISSAFLGA